MNWKAYFSSPPPDTVWHVDDGMAMVVHRHRKGGERCAAADLPHGAVEMGTAGIRALDDERLGKILEPLQAQVEGSRRAAIVIPTAWVRTFLVDLEDLPRRQRDLLEVLRWRLKKILGMSPIDLRLAASVQPAHGAKRHVLCTVALEKAMTQLEAAFAAVKVAPGLIVPRALALLMDPSDTDPVRLIVQQERSLLSILLFAAGGVRLVRTKMLPSVSGVWDPVEREISLAVTYIRSQLGFDGPIVASVSAQDSESQIMLSSFLEAPGGIEVREAVAGPLCGDPGFTERLGRCRVAPVVAVLRGGNP